MDVSVKNQLIVFFRGIVATVQASGACKIWREHVGNKLTCYAMKSAIFELKDEIVWFENWLHLEQLPYLYKVCQVGPPTLDLLDIMSSTYFQCHLVKICHWSQMHCMKMWCIVRYNALTNVSRSANSGALCCVLLAPHFIFKLSESLKRYF